MSQLSVDTGHHVITDIQAYHADKKDNQYLQDITRRLKTRLNQESFLWQNLLADTGFNSGENYRYLEEIGLRKINTIGIKQANKVMHLSAMPYNLKKYLKFTQKSIKIEAKNKLMPFSEKCILYELKRVILRFLNFRFLFSTKNNKTCLKRLK